MYMIIAFLQLLGNGGGGGKGGGKGEEGGREGKREEGGRGREGKGEGRGRGKGWDWRRESYVERSELITMNCKYSDIKMLTMAMNIVSK